MPMLECYIDCDGGKKRQWGAAVTATASANSMRLRPIEKWLPGQGLDSRFVQMSLIQKLSDAFEIFAKE
jgi:hypothetical protein